MLTGIDSVGSGGGVFLLFVFWISERPKGRKGRVEAVTFTSRGMILAYCATFCRFKKKKKEGSICYIAIQLFLEP